MYRCSCVPIKLYLQNQIACQIWPTGDILLTSIIRISIHAHILTNMLSTNSQTRMVESFFIDV